VAAVGLGQALFGLDLVPQAAAPAATLANRNVAAGYLVVVAPLALLAWSSRLARAGAAVALAAALAFLPFTRSRAAFLALALQLALLALARTRPALRRSHGDLRVAPCLLATSLALLLGAAWLTRADPEKAESTSLRWRLAGSALSMAGDHPILGMGLGGFGTSYRSHGPALRSARGTPLRVASPHNESLEILAETGLPGLVAGLWVAVAAVFATRRLRLSPDPVVRRAALALGLSLTGFAVDAALGFPLRYPVSLLALAVLLGLLTALDAGEPPSTANSEALSRLAPASRPLRLAAGVCLGALLAFTWSSSRARLEDDRGRYLAALLPVAHAQQACASGITLDRGAAGRIDLSAHAVPLVDVLRCLVERAGLRVEYDGPPPRQLVSVALHADSLASTLESLLEGLGVNYLLSRNASGTAVERLIVFGSTRATEPSRGAGAPAAAAGAAPSEEPFAPREPSSDDESLPFGPPPSAAPGAFPGLPGSLGSEPPAGQAPGLSPEPLLEPNEPLDLTPVTLQLGRPGASTL
jgi:hypothetical protein